MGAARRVEDVGEVLVAEGSELVQDDAQDRTPTLPGFPALSPGRRHRSLVSLTHHELKVLQEHLAQGPHGLRVLVDVEADKQDQLLLNDLVDRQQVFIRPGDDRQFVVQKRHALVQQALDLRHPLPVLE